jgi:chitin synthase
MFCFYLTFASFSPVSCFTIGLPSEVQVHCFERTASLFVPPRKEGGNETVRDPLQVIFALKEHNGGKQHSQLWFFYAFAAQLFPKYCVLIDVGTKVRVLSA